MNFVRTLILTHRPVVNDGWFDDFKKIFYDRDDFFYGSKNKGNTFDYVERLVQQRTGHYVYFASLQDLRGSELVGGKFDKNDEIFGVNAISDIVVYGSKVIVCALNQEDGTIMHIYDKESGEPLKHTLNYGRGPKELLFLSNISFLQESGTMVFFDIIASKRLDIDVDGLMEHGLDAVEEVYWPSRLWNLRNIALENGSLHTYNISYLQRDTSSVERIELCDRNGNIISTYNEFPVIDDDRKRFMMYNNEIIAVSPDEEKFVITTSVGGILEIFSMRDGELKNITTKYFIEPDFSMEGNIYNYDNLIYIIPRKRKKSTQFGTALSCITLERCRFFCSQKIRSFSGHFCRTGGAYLSVRNFKEVPVHE